MRISLTLFVLAVLSIGAPVLRADDPLRPPGAGETGRERDGDDVSPIIPHRQDRPPNRPYSPLEAMERMVVPEGFSVELVASEPEIVNPLAMAFDDRGRIWVTESVEYPRREAGPGRDRVQVLEDTDGDGRADRFTVFAEGLNIPSGIAVGHGGVWVLNAPDLLFFREEDAGGDGNGGGKASAPEVIVTGFGRTDTHELPNSLTWGPDGWLYGLNGVFNQSRVVSRGREYRFTCALFRVDPRTHDFQVVCEGTSNPWGLVWDSEGSAIVSACHWAKDHVFHFVETGYYQRQAGAYPSFTWKIGSASDHGHQKTAYCGLAYLDSDAYPERFRRRLYMGNVHGGAINTDVLERDGSTYLSRAEPDFLSARDAWFMPVSQQVGPDGCLYILDWYDRYHCYQDANRDPGGIDRQRGRLYRVRYRETPRAQAFDLALETDGELLERLASSNVFYRERAQRILAERLLDGRGGDPLRARLRHLVRDPSRPRPARLHALWTLVGSKSLEPDFHLALLGHPDPTFRAWAVRAAGDFRRIGPAVRERVAALALDASPDVVLQAAIAARKIDGLDPLAVLTGALAACGTDKLVPAVVWPNLHPLLESRAGEFARLAAEARLDLSPGLAATLPRALERVLGCAEPETAAAAAMFSAGLSAPGGGLASECLAVLARKLPDLSQSARAELASHLRSSLEALLASPAGEETPVCIAARLLAARLGIGRADPDAARRTFLSESESEPLRLQAFEALVVGGDPRLLDAAGHVLAPGSAASPSLVRGVLAALGRTDEPRVADLVLARFSEIDAAVRPIALDLLLERRAWARRLLDSVLLGKLPETTLQPEHLRRILAGNDREAIWAIEKRWGRVRMERSPDRESVVREMARTLRSEPGDPVAGRSVFRRLCAQCHTIYGEGDAVGPDLTTNGRASFDQLLTNVFDPSAVIGPGYEAWTVVTTGGRVLSGLRVEDSELRIVLKMQGGRTEAIPRGEVKYASSSALSLMPEGLEGLASRRELADLFAFLALDGPPENDPRPIPGAPVPGGR